MRTLFTDVPDTYACPSRARRIDIAAFAAALAVSPAAASLLEGGEPPPQSPPQSPPPQLPPPPLPPPPTAALAAAAAAAAAAAGPAVLPCPLLSVRRATAGAADGGRRWLATHGGAVVGVGAAAAPRPPPPLPAGTPPAASSPLRPTSPLGGSGGGGGGGGAPAGPAPGVRPGGVPSPSALPSHLVPGDVVVHVAIYAAQAPVVAVEALLLGTSPLAAVRDVLFCPADEEGRRGRGATAVAAAAADADAGGGDGVPPPVAAPRTGLLVAEGVAYHVRRAGRMGDQDTAGLASWLAFAAATGGGAGKSDEEEGSGGEDAPAAPSLPLSSVRPRRGGCRRRGVTVSPVPAEALPLTAFRPRRGVPYMVAHGNGCEHLWVVRDVRAPVGGAGGDPRVRAAYPAVVARAPRRLRKCAVCNVAPAAWVTWDDPLADASPCFFCGACYDALHLDAAGAPTVEHLDVHPYRAE
ncbi:hypothetical protein I4F81_009211 [Pyropia yezoensis]|uniref:Uncharacterized protein n=1 Tax=Pyropia yezoensis TaxID=2788 RepID=A0ACC3C9A2_PYRYE|nr:hypothetical protein I4F81_009211 [Neopyropia yezoensis]